jgi:hypothetical protein
MDFSSIYHRVMKFGLEVLGLYYSYYPAHVVENEDPQEQGRLLLVLSSILGPDSRPVWSYPIGQFSGDDCGAHWMPPIGSVVMVQFLNGQLKNPVWTYYWPLSGKRPVEFKSPKTFGWKTPGGYYMIMDEFDKSIHIKHPEGPEIQMVENTITIKTKERTITLDDTGISIDAGDQDIVIHNDNNSLSITDSGIDIDSDKSINVGGQFNVLYSLVPNASAIADVSQIGVSTKVKVG